ncbi:MAG: copper chaperone PCu(A)C [Halarcobacter sp.]
MKSSKLVSTLKILTLSSIFAVSALMASQVEIEDAYVRATPPGLPNSAAFLTIKNESDKDVSILNAFSKVSKVVELHTHDMKDGVMKMYRVEKIDVPAKGQTVLKPGGYHIMLIGLNKALKVGEDVTFSLELSNGETLTIVAPVKTVMSGMKHNGNKMMMGSKK